MTTLTLKNPGLFRKSLFWALLIHLIIFNLFTLTIPILHASSKPTFFFLGAILKPKDFWIITNKKKTKTNLENSKKISSSFVKNPNVSIADTRVKKPLFSRNTSEKEQKHTIKPIFLEEEAPKTNTADMFKKLGISEKISSYKPLSLH